MGSWLARWSELAAALRGQPERAPDGDSFRRPEPADPHVWTLVALRMGQPLAGGGGLGRRRIAEVVHRIRAMSGDTPPALVRRGAALRASRDRSDPAMSLRVCSTSKGFTRPDAAAVSGSYSS
jgi:hypothetical protein